MPSYFCLLTDVQARLSVSGVRLRLDDDPSIITYVQQEATNKIRLYCAHLYKESDLLANANNGGWVNDAATTLATGILCRRRGNPIPTELKESYRETMDELELINRDLMQIPGYAGEPMAQRHTSMPTFSNLTVRPWYDLNKVRVERQISEGTAPVGYGQKVDWHTEFLVEY
jgi:hypothetical protein